MSFCLLDDGMLRSFISWRSRGMIDILVGGRILVVTFVGPFFDNVAFVGLFFGLVGVNVFGGGVAKREL